MVPGTCQLCGEETSLTDSHIFPEFFYEGTYDESGRFMSVTNHPRHKPRPMQRGLTEPLLCLRCEARLGRYESYGATLLRRADAAATDGGDVILENVDFTTFRLFGLSILWRLHIARGHMFAAVSLGPRGIRLRDMLLAEDSGEPYEFGFVLTKVVGLETHGTMIIAPMARRFWGHRAYQFMARGYEWVFVVSGNAGRTLDAVPYVASLPLLYIPRLARDRQTLFAKLRKAFPKALGQK